MSHAHTIQHFTGKKGSGAKRKQKLTPKQKLKKRGTHRNKYADKKEESE